MAAKGSCCIKNVYILKKKNLKAYTYEVKEMFNHEELNQEQLQQVSARDQEKVSVISNSSCDHQQVYNKENNTTKWCIYDCIIV